MKRKQLLVLIVAAAVLVVIGAMVSRMRTSAWQGGGEDAATPMLPDFPLNDVVRVEIEGSDGTVTIAREQNRWRVKQRHGYPANYTTLKGFMIDLTETKVAQTVNVGPSQYGRLDLAEPGADDSSGIRVAFYDQGGAEIRTLLFGKEHTRKGDEAQPNPMMGMMGGGDFPTGRYILLPDRQKVVLVGETFSSVKVDPSAWMDKEFFKIGDVKEASLSEGGEEIWRVSRESKSDDLSLEGPIPEDKEVDTSKLSSIKSAFSWASFNDIADPELSPEETGMDNPKVYVARQFDGLVYTVRIGKKTDDGKHYLQAEVAYEGPTEREAAEDESEEDRTREDETFARELKEKQDKAKETNDRLRGWTYIVSRYTVDSVSESRDNLLKDKPEPEEDETDDKTDENAGTQAGEATPPDNPETAD